MAVIPNRIVLISNGRHDEAVADIDCWPGMLLTRKSNGNVIPHNSMGGGGPLLVAKEDALQGLDITQKLPTPNVIPFQLPTKGDLMLMLLQNGQNAAQAANLISAGDGTLMVSPSRVLVDITTPSAVITNLGTETTFSNGTYTFAANSLAVGDVINIHAKTFLIAVNSTNTHRIRVYIGATTLADAGAVAMVANDVAIIDITMTIRTIGASGTFIADGVCKTTISGTFTTVPFTVASTAIDTTVAEILAVKSLASATSAGNQIRLDEFLVELDRGAGLNLIGQSAEAINNSSGTGTSGFNTAAFIRVWVP